MFDPKGRLCLVAAAVLAVAGCSDTSSGPAGGAPVTPDGSVHEVRWASLGTPREFRMNYRGGGPAGSAPADPVLTGSFWAFTDRDVTYTVSVVGQDGLPRPYLKLTVPRGSLLRRPGGAFFGLRDSIQITVSVDPSQLQAELDPTGLVFNPLNPATLTLSYADADPDFNGDGLVDAADDYIAQVLLGIRTRETALDAWTVIPSLNDIVNRQLIADLPHFTGYAVAW